MKVRIQWRKHHRSPKHRLLRWVQRSLFVAGWLALAFCALVYFRASLFQARENRRFENNRLQSVNTVSAVATLVGRERALRLSISEGSPISRLDIPRIRVSVMVVDGIGPHSLSLAAGHVPGTAFPDESGNVGIAGHRDTFFRNLRDIREDDLITLTTLHGSYQYSVEWTRVVAPSDVEVLRTSNQPILTLVTCYPFYYVGSAPERFIVRAKQIGCRRAHEITGILED